jgi:hypothetical protein
MPNHEEHCQHSEKRYGFRGDDIHTWMDEPSFFMGPAHREERHNRNRDLPIVIKMFGDKYGEDVARHIFLDHIYLDAKERARKDYHPEPDYSEPSHSSSTYSPSSYGSVSSFPIGGTALIETLGAIAFGLVVIWAFNNAFYNPIGAWWNQNWISIVGATIFLVIIGILALYMWYKLDTKT